MEIYERKAHELGLIYFDTYEENMAASEHAAHVLESHARGLTHQDAKSAKFRIRK